MVLAHSLGEAGGPVVLVSDDFKMATTAETADLAFDSCPPSTFIERLVENGGDAARDARLRSLSRQVRASEMKYAISRREDVEQEIVQMEAEERKHIDNLRKLQDEQKAAYDALEQALANR